MSTDTRASWMPSVGDIIYVLILQLIFVFLPTFIFGDGSTGWHLVSGQYILNNFQVPHTDLISYTFPDKPWVAYEWFFDLLIAILDKTGGLRLVAVAVCSAIAWLFLLLYEDCRKRGSHFLIAMTLCIMGALISAIHWLARPHLFAFFGVYFSFRLLLEFQENKIALKKLLILLGMIMLFWVNSHPSFLMAAVICLIFLLSELATAFVWAASAEKQEYFARARGFAFALLTVALVSLLNPYGLQLYQYIWDYLHQSAVLAQNDEFSSPVFHGQLQTALLEILYFLLALGLLLSKKKPSLAAFLTVLAYGHLSLASKRNMPLFVIVSLPLIAEMLAHADFRKFLPEHISAKFQAASWLESVKKVWNSAGATMDATEFSCTKHLLPILASLTLAVSCFKDGKLLHLELVRSGFDPKNKPVETLAAIKANKLSEKAGFTYDNWGGYIRYKTGMRVFIDDRSDFYGQKFYFEYADTSTGQANWPETLDKYKISWVLFPNNSVLVANLEKDAGWKLLCKDKASSLFVRNGLTPEPASD